MKSTYMAVMVSTKSDSDIDFRQVFSRESIVRLMAEAKDQKIKKLFEIFEDGTTREMTLVFKDGYIVIVPKEV